MTRRPHDWLVSASLGVVALLSGCSSGNCLALCSRQVTFALGTAVAGQDFRITAIVKATQVGQTLECQGVDGGAASCGPTPSKLMAQFDDAGRLRSVVWSEPESGPLEMQITVDGNQVADSTFDYMLVPDGEICGTTCYQSPTFTIQN